MNRRWIQFMGRWYIAPECEDKKKGLYYLINGHICPVGELDDVGEYLPDDKN